MKSKLPQYYNSSPKTEKLAKSLRRKSTDAEKLVWKIIRGRNFKGLKFRRQHPIGSYIVDFYCHELKLVIELDGDVHSIGFINKQDKVRKKNIEKLGLKVLRFENELVLSNPDMVIEEISKYMATSP